MRLTSFHAAFQQILLLFHFQRRLVLPPIPEPLGVSGIDPRACLLSVSWLRFLHVFLLSSCQDFVAIVFPLFVLSLWVMP